MLASRLVELERKLDGAEEQAASELWAEFYTALDLWLRCRAPAAPTNPPITVAQLQERFNAAKR